MKKFLHFVVALLVLFHVGIARADGVNLPDPPSPVPGELDVGAAVSPIRKGQVAPFTGVLLSPKALATIIVELSSFDARMKLELKKSQDEWAARCDFKVAEVQTKADADKKVMQAQLDERMKTVDILQQKLADEEANRPNMPLWVGLAGSGGFVLGVGLAALTAFTVNKSLTK